MAVALMPHMFWGMLDCGMSAADSSGGKEQGCDLVAAAGSGRSAGEVSELVRVFDSQQGDCG